MKKKALLLIAPIITIILEALPYGVKMYFWTINDPISKHTSYFDTLPYGYAIVSPLITAVLSCVILALLITYCLWAKPLLLKTTKILLYIATVLSMFHFLLGFKYVTVVGVMVTLSLVIELIVIRVLSTVYKTTSSTTT